MTGVQTCALPISFVETLVPIAHDTAWAKSFDLNAAVRYADYNLSGGVTTWKGGLVYQPIEGLRLRGTRSRDIRAGNLNELFAAGTSTQPSVSDPFRNNVVTTTIASTRGNPDLLPEEADTTTFGFTYQPSWLQGAGLSVDWYDIQIDGAITALPFQTIVDQCFEGNAGLCDLITRDANGVIVFIEGRTLNAALLETSGIDFEVTYQRPVGPGNLGLRLLGTYSEELVTTVVGGVPRDNGGEIGFPPWKATAVVKYDSGPLAFFLQERYIGESTINNTFTELDIDDNDVPSVLYTDLTAHYRPGGSGKLEFFGTVNNLFDERPPHEVGHFFVIATRVTGNATPYDVVGRAFTLGFTWRP